MIEYIMVSIMSFIVGIIFGRLISKDEKREKID